MGSRDGDGKTRGGMAGVGERLADAVDAVDAHTQNGEEGLEEDCLGSCLTSWCRNWAAG